MDGRLRRVLMTADTVGGVWTYALDLARGLQTAGVEVILATMGPEPASAQVSTAGSLPNVRLVTGPFALEWMDDPWDDVMRAGEWLLELESRFAPDVVHLNGYAHGGLPFHAPTVVVGHSCLLSWADAVPAAIEPRRLAEYRAHAQSGLAQAELVVAPSCAMAAALEQHYGPLERLRVVYNGRRSGLFAPGVKEPFILTAGRLWDRAKNVEAVTAVAARLRWPTAVAGPHTIDATGRAIERPGTRMLGVLNEMDLARWLARASIFAVPARYEPFGLLPLEAAMSGCALMLGDIPSLREIWGDAADYVPPDDTRALETQLSALIARPARIRERADAARRRAVRYSLERMVDGYLTAYADCLALSRSHGALPCAS